jgi:hypothetical protein
MSILEEMHHNRKARLARLGAGPIVQSPHQAVAPKPAPEPRPEPKPEPIKAAPLLAVLDYLPGGPVRIERIVRIVSEHFGIASADLLSARRTAHLILPRHIIYCLCKQLTLHPLPAIGKRLGGRDHTTVLYGVRKIEGILKEDADLRASFDELVNRIGGTDQSDKRLPRKRLTEQQVREIRASDLPHVDLARQFGVTHGAIWHVRTNRTWSHLK